MDVARETSAVTVAYKLNSVQEDDDSLHGNDLML